MLPFDNSFALAADALRDQHQSRFNDRDSELYAIPELLLDALAIEVPKLIASPALELEYTFTRTLRSHHAIGVQSGKPIRCSLFESRSAVVVSPEDFDELGWSQTGLTLEDTNRFCQIGETRTAPFHDQLCAYAGWLVTNTAFLDEMKRLKQREQELLAADSNDEEAKECLVAFEAFLDKWQLARLASWDLPEPLGPNLAGIEPPNAAARTPPAVDLRLPLTLSIPVRLGVHEIVDEIRRDKSESHLQEWQDILARSGKSKSAIGLSRFRHILQIQFFRNIVLVSRYGDRFEGNVQAIDRAFGQFLGRPGEDTVKSLRLEIRRRLQVD